MARKIRYPLEMKNGASVRTIEDLQNNFDIDSVLGYFLDGKLETWLRDRYYDEKAEAISQLSHDDEELASKICEIIGVKWKSDSESVDLEIIQRRKEKLDIIRGFTCDREIIDNIDYVALNQDDLFDILDMSPKNVWLYGEKFSIPIGKKNVLYIGLNDPLVILERDKYVGDYVKAGTSFKDVSFEKYIDPEQRYIEGRWKEAFPELLSMAENGNPRAMYIVAMSYRDGCGVHGDALKWFIWLGAAYGYNEPISTMNYAYFYESNKEREKNILKMFSEPLKKLAETGDILAKFEYAYYLNNYSKEKVKAFQIMKECADYGFIPAQCQLGMYYFWGTGTEQDYVKAVEWYRKAADQGYSPAKNNLGDCYAVGKGVEQDYVKAAEWFREAADQGYYWGQRNLGNCYSKGDGVEQDYMKAVEWYRKGYDPKDIEDIAKVYENKQDYENALKCRYAAVEANSTYSISISNIGWHFYYGKGVDVDYNKAYKQFESAYNIKPDDGWVCNKMGECYEYGRGVNKNIDEAKKYYKKAADAGNEDAKQALSRLN